VPLSLLRGDAAKGTTSGALDSSEGKMQTTPARLADGYQVKALVADDIQENRDVLSKILEDIGVLIITAEDGQQALFAVRAEQPDIVFMDIRMPVMDGLQAAQQIIKEFDESRPKLVAVSASALIHERRGYLEAGFDDFIAKPFRAEQIYNCLARLLQIEYDYKQDISVSIDFEELVIPEELLSRLKEAAEFGEVTALRECIEEVRQIGEQGHLLAERLSELSRNLEMNGILELLGAVSIAK